MGGRDREQGVWGNPLASLGWRGEELVVVPKHW